MIVELDWQIGPTPRQPLGDRRRFPAAPDAGHDEPTHTVREVPRVCQEAIDAGGDLLDCLCDPAPKVAAKDLRFDDQPSIAEHLPATPAGTRSELKHDGPPTLDECRTCCFSLQAAPELTLADVDKLLPASSG